MVACQKLVCRGCQNEDLDSLVTDMLQREAIMRHFLRDIRAFALHNGCTTQTLYGRSKWRDISLMSTSVLCDVLKHIASTHRDFVWSVVLMTAIMP